MSTQTTNRRTHAVTAIQRLSAVARESEVERLLGLSRGYLSRIRAGAEPGDVVVRLLVLVAASPRRRINELRQTWQDAAPASARKEG
jgi:hypothetical protein